MSSSNQRMGGNRTAPENPGETEVSWESGAESGALGAREAPIDADSATVVDAWPTLPEAVKAGVLAMVRAADAGK